jgi:opacity protein-like surface antigen
MKTKLAIALLAALAAGPAFAADVYHHDGGLKDDSPGYSGERRADHSGLYITGDLGIASGDRSTTVRNNRAIDLDVTDPAYTAVLDGADGSAPNGVISDAEREAASAFLDTFNVPHTITEDSLNIPLIADRLGIGNDSDFDATAFGAELSYLWQLPGRRLGLELGVGATFYQNSETGIAYTGQNGAFVGGTAAADAAVGGVPLCTGIGTCAGDPSIPQSGFAKVERNFDIDLIGRLHYFVTRDLSLSGGGGISFARADISGGTFDDTGAFGGLNTRFSGDESSIGYVLNAGVNWWVADYIRLSAEYSFKHHEFSGGGSAADNLNLAPGVDLNGSANTKVDVEDDIHAIKGRIGIILN